MSKRVNTLVVDDLEESRNPGSNVPADITFIFGVKGGRLSEIDLSEGNAAILQSLLDEYQAAARPASLTAAAPRRARAHKDAESARIRDWARKKGLLVQDRGRIPAGIRQQFNADTAVSV